jgi:hypothetical protein
MAFMSKRLWGYLSVICGVALAGTLVESPAWAEGLEAARSRGGFGLLRGIGLLCCLIVVALVVLGVGIGLAIGRRRRGGPGPDA